jgi:hypothetical protein
MIAVSKKSIENVEENLPSPIKNRLSYEVLNKDLSDSGWAMAVQLKSKKYGRNNNNVDVHFSHQGVFLMLRTSVDGQSGLHPGLCRATIITSAHEHHHEIAQWTLDAQMKDGIARWHLQRGRLQKNHLYKTLLKSFNWRHLRKSMLLLRIIGSFSKCHR